MNALFNAELRNLVETFEAAEGCNNQNFRTLLDFSLGRIEATHDLALAEPDATGVFLFEDHKIARASFQVPGNWRRVGTRAWLRSLEGKGQIASAADVELAAFRNESTVF